MVTTMMENKDNIAVALARAKAIASEKGVNLTFSNLQVYIALLTYATTSPNVKEYKYSFKFLLSGKELAIKSNVSLKIASESMKKFAQCGLLEYSQSGSRPAMIELKKTIE